MGRETLQFAPRKKAAQPGVGEVFTGLIAGLQDIRKKGETIILEDERKAGSLGSLKPTDVKTTAFSDSMLTADTIIETGPNCEGLEGTGTGGGGQKKPV